MSVSSTGEGTRVVWQGQIEQLFAAPYWIPLAQRQATAEGWRGWMTGYGIDLAQYDSVKQWAVLIYHYLHSREMPLTSNPQEYWPDEALERLRAWINDGCPRTLQDTIVHCEIPAAPLGTPLTAAHPQRHPRADAGRTRRLPRAPGRHPASGQSRP